MEEEDRTELRDQNISYLKQRRVNILFKGMPITGSECVGGGGGH